jgi:hypothetical protein
VFCKLGCDITGKDYIYTRSSEKVKAHVRFFGCTPLACSQLWETMDTGRGRVSLRPRHLLWALLELRTYSKEDVLCFLCGIRCRKTFRRWASKAIQALSEIDSLIRWERRFEGCTSYINRKAFITVDGTDFTIPEPTPFSPKWYSHKHNGPGVRYEVGIAIDTGFIVWINGPFPCGEWPDLIIVRSALVHMLARNEWYVADGGYYDGKQYSITPSGLRDFEDRQYATARARHETINRKFKEFSILRGTFRHPLHKHGVAFRAVTNIVQLGLQTDRPSWQVYYNEGEH